jgi:hypothetical protein
MSSGPVIASIVWSFPESVTPKSWELRPVGTTVVRTVVAVANITESGGHDVIEGSRTTGLDVIVVDKNMRWFLLGNSVRSERLNGRADLVGVNVTGAWPSFVVNPYVTKTSNANHMKVTVCVNLNVGINDTVSNMAVMEVNLPSGFTADLDSLPALRRYKGVKRVESDKGDTRVILYFDGLKRPTNFDSNEVCPTVQAFRTHRVAKQKPAHVLVYDYYDQSRRARSFYDIVPATLCDICDGDDCPDDGCPDRPQFPTFGSYAFRETPDDGSNDGTRTHVSCFMTILAFIIARFF